MSRYAIVTLVMLGDRYVPGARVFARSTRDHLDPTRARSIDLVCMVTTDVSASARKALSHDFDRLIDVPLLTATYVKTNGIFDHKYGSWIAHSYTKWNCLGLFQYDRIGFFDADILVLNDISASLMDPTYLDQPAGVFSNSWSSTVLSMTPERIDANKTPMVDTFAPFIRGDGRSCRTIPRSAIRDALDGPIDYLELAKWTGMRFVCAGSSIFFRPFRGGTELFIQHLTRLAHPNPRCGGSGPDDQSIVRFLLEYHPIHSQHDWQFLHAGWCFIPWKDALLSSQGLTLEDGIIQHYFNQKKPWESIRTDWPDLETWWLVHDRLVQDRSDPTTTAADENVPSVTELIPTTGQFHQLIQTSGPLLNQLLKTQLRRYPRLHEQLWNQAQLLIRDHPTSDDVIYDGLREFYHTTLLAKTTSAARAKALEAKEVGASEGRADYRASQVANYLTGVRSMLDLGCGNGTITESLNALLALERCTGVDIDITHLIRPLDSKVQYHQVLANKPLPLVDQSVDAVTCLMSLHHMRDLTFKLSEAARVCKPGGKLVLREHDAPPNDNNFVALIDVMHGLYARVWPAVPECESFSSSHYALYRSRAAWREMIGATGNWKHVNGTLGLDGGSIGRFYYDVWERL